MAKTSEERDERAEPVEYGTMRSYLGEDVSQETLDMLVRTYKGGYAAVSPDHQEPEGDDEALLAELEAAEVRGGPDADALGRAAGAAADAEPTPGSGIPMAAGGPEEEEEYEVDEEDEEQEARDEWNPEKPVRKRKVTKRRKRSGA